MDKLVVINKNTKCSFCGTSKNDCLQYGPIYKLGNIRAHYYCVLLSNRLIQNGNDNEGILGFLLSDIQKELQRTLSIVCMYCKRGNATIKCAAKKCRGSFHLPCGIKGGSLHEFANQFKSFCHKHRPSQIIPRKILKEACKTKTLCCICFEKVDVNNKRKTLWAPCCVRTWYHRFCVQKLAYSAGYFFRCAACNDVQKFNKWMQKFGIFIPQQDASWELVPNAFEELLYRHNKCDAEKCKCPEGRQKNADNTIWEIVLCESCGSQGIHVACGNLKFLDPEWECPTCQKITQNLNSNSEINDTNKPDDDSSVLPKLTEICQKKRRRGSEDLKNSVLDKRKKCRILNEEDCDETEIDVETVEEESKNKDAMIPKTVDDSEDIEVLEVNPKKDVELQEVLAALKPGPISYKLSLIEKIAQLSPPKKPIQEPEVIELSDSDEEKDDHIRPTTKYSNEDESVEDETKGSQKDGHVDIEVIDEAEEPSGEFVFSFSFHSMKWQFHDEIFIENKISTNTDFAKEKKTQIKSTDLFLPSVIKKTTHLWSPEKEITLQDCNLDMSKSDLRKEKEEDLRSVSDDDVIIITN